MYDPLMARAVIEVTRQLERPRQRRRRQGLFSRLFRRNRNDGDLEAEPHIDR